MATNKVSFTYLALDKYSRVARTVKNVTNATRASFRGMTKEVGRASKQFGRYKKKIDGIKKSAMAVGKTLATHVSLPMAAVGTAALIQSAKFENFDIAFETLIGNAAEAKKTMASLVDFTASTPFQMDEVANAGKQLLAFGVKSGDVTGVLRSLGDMASGLGKPLSEFSLIYGKILAKGKVQGEEMLQLAEKGISLQTILAKKYGVTTAQVTEAVSKGQISFDIFKEAIGEITSKGGKFFNMTQKQSKSLGGLWSTFKDAIVLSLRALGDLLVKNLSLKDLLASIIVKMNAFAKGLSSFSKNHPTLTRLLLLFSGLLFVLAPIILVGAQVAAMFAIMAAAAATFGVALSPILITVGLVALALAAVAGAGLWVYSNWEAIGGTINQMVLNFQAFIKMWENGAKIISQKISFGGISDFFGFGDEEISTSNKSRTDVNVNLNAPSGAVQSIKSKTTGSTPGLNVGVSMAASL